MASEPSDFTFRVTEKPDEVSIVIAGTLDETTEMAVPDVRGRRVGAKVVPTPFYKRTSAS